MITYYPGQPKVVFVSVPKKEVISRLENGEDLIFDNGDIKRGVSYRTKATTPTEEEMEYYMRDGLWCRVISRAEYERDYPPEIPKTWDECVAEIVADLRAERDEIEREKNETNDKKNE